MARVLVPTMRARVDPNPRGSATTHVTMAAANPFEREVISLRPANQPRDMLPGMGDFSSDFATGFTGGETSPAPAPGGGSAPAPSSGSVWGSIAQQIISGVGIPLLQQEVLKAPQPTTMTGPTMQTMQGQQAQQLPSAQSAALPVSGQITAMQPAIMIPPQQPSGMARYLPWVLGGAAVLGIGALMLRGGRGRRK